MITTGPCALGRAPGSWVKSNARGGVSKLKPHARDLPSPDQVPTLQFPEGSRDIEDGEAKTSSAVIGRERLIQKAQQRVGLAD